MKKGHQRECLLLKGKSTDSLLSYSFGLLLKHRLTDDNPRLEGIAIYLNRSVLIFKSLFSVMEYYLVVSSLRCVSFQSEPNHGDILATFVKQMVPKMLAM